MEPTVSARICLATALLALDLRTGKRLWHFQFVHHDLWDYDPTTAPKLLTVQHEGKPVDVVAQPTKFGFLYVFYRVTGEPLWPIEERPVPKTDMPGEQSWPTQPFPTKPAPFARQKFTVDEINPYWIRPRKSACETSCGRRATKASSLRLPVLETRSPCRVKMGAPTGAAPPATPKPECCMCAPSMRQLFIS